MAVSQNNWPVVSRSACDEGPFEGIQFPNGILAGDVAYVMRWHLRRYRQTVEPIVNGTCWGWNAKRISGSDDWSNHASGTAWDINAPQHPMGPPVRTNMSQREIDACHALEAESGHVIRWGGDFSRPDPMHWEIRGSRSQVAALARKIREGEADMTQDEMLDALESPRGRAALRSALVELAYGPADNRESIAGRIGNIDAKIDGVSAGVALLVNAIPPPESNPAEFDAGKPDQFEADRPHGSNEPHQESPV